MIDEKLLAMVKELAISSDWRVREDAATEIKKINDKSFREYLSVWKQWVKDQNKYVRWNVAMCLGVRFGQAYPDEALQMLKELASDEERFVWRAAAATLVKLIRKHPKLNKEVLLWENCEGCLNIVKKYIRETYNTHLKVGESEDECLKR